jgi:TatD DNase family protein
VTAVDNRRAARVIDSHCHLQSLTASQVEVALEDARGRGVVGFLVPALRLEEAEEILALCHREPDVWCALGVHPHEASSWTSRHQEALSKLVPDPKVVAVGECGLDFHYDLSDRTAQEWALREQWELAQDRGLPVVVHNRDSNEVMLDVLSEAQFEGLECDFHSFAGGLEMARRLVARGSYLGFSGMVTFAKAQNVREVLSEVPVDRILVETDTPYLAPVPFRGQASRPVHVVEVARGVAKELALGYEELCQSSCRNFFRLFRKAAENYTGFGTSSK